jgi:hemerythrin-like domain-containing protein
MHEHRVIERMITVLERELGVIRASGQVDSRTIEAAVDFIRTYADRCHHGKEEDILFRRLEEKPLSPEMAVAMAGLVADHVHGREVTRGLVSADERYRTGDTSALVEIEEALAELVSFYPVHIEKEDHSFFKPCFEYFTAEEKARMLADFDEFDRALIHERYLGVVEALEAQSG